MRIILLSLVVLLAGCEQFAPSNTGKPSEVNDATAKAFEACIGKGGTPTYISTGREIKLDCTMPEPKECPECPAPDATE